LMKAGSSKKSAMIGAAFMDKTVPNPKQWTWEVPDPNQWTWDDDPWSWTWW
jgi:hypothetical protein